MTISCDVTSHRISFLPFQVRLNQKEEGEQRREKEFRDLNSMHYSRYCSYY